MMRDHGLPEEDAVPLNGAADSGPRVIVIAVPHASNLDEFEPLRNAGVQLTFARDGATIKAADWLILPGSKQARADLSWLKDQGLAHLIRAHVDAQRPLLAVCGGLQWLGQRLEDPLGVEGAPPGSDEGLGLLPLNTRYQTRKQLARVRARFGPLEPPWAALCGLEFDGYEIHVGETQLATSPAIQSAHSVLTSAAGSRPIGWQCGSILAVYAHGLFENPSVLAALFGVTRNAPGIQFDAMAAHVGRSFRAGFLESLTRPQVAP